MKNFIIEFILGIPLDLDTRQQIVKLFQKGVKVNAIAKQVN